MRRRWEDPEYRARREAVAEETKRKQAAAAREQWADPEYRARARAGLKGRAAWNKGRKLSAAHRQRIREAKAGRKVSEATKERMRAAARGRRHSEATRAKMSGSRKGRKLSPAHREAISLAMLRRRGGGGGGAGTPGTAAAAAAATTEAEAAVAAETAAAVAAAAAADVVPDFVPGGGRGDGGVGEAGPSGRGVLTTCRQTLQEFRALKGALAPWVAEFAEKHGRAPELHDAQTTGDLQLAARVLRCARLRQQLQLQIPKLRSTGAFTGSGSPGSAGGGAEGGGPEGRGAEAQPGGSDTAMRKALEYKAKQAQRQQGGAGKGKGKGASAEEGAGRGEACEVRPLRSSSPLMPGRVRAAFDRAAKYRGRG